MKTSELFSLCWNPLVMWCVKISFGLKQMKQKWHSQNHGKTIWNLQNHQNSIPNSCFIGKKKPWPHRNSGAFFNERLPLMNAYLEPSTKKKQTTLIRLSFGVDTAGHRRCRYAKFLRFKFLLRLAAKLIDIVRVLSLGFVFLGWLGFYFRSIKIVINQFNSY